jgi:hypothetical protein
MQIDDGNFDEMHQKFLASGQTYSIPFYNWSSTNSTNNTLGGTTKFQVSTQSVNKCISIITPGDSYPIVTAGNTTPAVAGTKISPLQGCSTYFMRIGGPSVPGNTTLVVWGTTGNTITATYNINNYIWNIN